MSDIIVLVVEDEDSIMTLIRFTLERAGFIVQTASNAEEAKKLLNIRLPDIALFDWMLPGESGVQLISQLRQDSRTCDLPMILLTARGTDEDKEKGLNLGADDYLTKPFSPRELLARINALLRRRSPQKTDAIILIQDLCLDPVQHQVFAGKEAIKLAPTEFKLLHFFMSHTGRVYSRRQLLDLVWGDHVFVEDRTVDVHIRRLRRALKPSGHDLWVQTIRSAGYRFSCTL